jgi:hypothetical protein
MTAVMAPMSSQIISRQGEGQESVTPSTQRNISPWRVASLFPELPESQLVLQFSTSMPKKKFGKEEGKVAKEYEDDVLLSAVARILLYFLVSSFATAPWSRTSSSKRYDGGLGYFCVLLVQLWSIHPWLAGLVIVLLLCLLCLGRFSLSGLAKKLKEEEKEEMRLLLSLLSKFLLLSLSP